MPIVPSTSASASGETQPAVWSDGDSTAAADAAAAVAAADPALPTHLGANLLAQGVGRDALGGERADELFAHTYAHLYGIPCTGLRFFTVYGPWGRPDMAPMLFARAIAAGEPIKVFNHGEMWRDFTYIDDIVAGVVQALDRPASGAPPHALYNLGNHKSEKLTDFIAEIEKALGKKTQMIMAPMQPGDVPTTFADIQSSTRDLGFRPTTPIGAGIPKFVAWFRDYYGV